MAFMTSVTGIANSNTVGTADEVLSLQGGWLYQVYITGTLSAGTESIQPYLQAPDGTWVAFGDAVTAKSVINVEAPSGSKFTVGVTSGDGSTSIDIAAVLLRNR
tara:strand:- start:442 stop:753 length:312 start_codon:yes stop_codon:yes gene_type:complete